MKYVILISHGGLAKGLKSAVEMMVGQRDDLLALSLEPEESIDDFAVKFAKLIEPMTSDDEVLLLCDILGGSPLTMSLATLQDKGLLEKTVAVTGMNMAMGITAMTMKDNMEMQELKDVVISEGKVSVSEFVLQSEDEEEDI